MRLVFAWALIQARTRVQLALACERSMIFAQRKLRLTMQHVYGHSGNLGSECADHAAALRDLTSLPQATTLPPVGFNIILMHLRVLMAVTTSLRSWNDYNTFEI